MNVFIVNFNPMANREVNEREFHAETVGVIVNARDAETVAREHWSNMFEDGGDIELEFDLNCYEIEPVEVKGIWPF